jgi:phosphoglycolate phosphatase
MIYTTAIFDLDGTLLDTLDDIADSVNATMAHFGFPTRTRDEVRSFVGNGAVNLIRRCVGETENFDEILAFYDKYYTEHSLIKTAPYPGIMEMLGELTRREIKLAVVSNKQDAAVKKLVRRFFDNYISVAIGERRSVRKKPAPDTVIAAMDELCSLNYECVYIGDSDVDIMTAKNSEMDCISVSWGFRSRDFLLEHGAARIIEWPKELVRIFR